MSVLSVLPSSRLSIQNVVALSVVIRVVLILYSEWHDARSVVKYTDIDYRVFSDASSFLFHPDEGNIAKGPLKWHVGNPYTRETYRYTPLLALLLIPNEFLPSFGKFLFAACDILNGLLIYSLLATEILPFALKKSPESSKSRPTASEVKKWATIYSAIHLLNPMVFSISTRGSSESVLSLFVLLTLYASLKGRWDMSAVLLGLSTHWKIYPLIYGVSCLGVIGSPFVNSTSRGGFFWQSIVNKKTIRFTLISAGTFIALGLACYVVWGYPFLYESYLYHIHRIDHRHNFSPYFYPSYLNYPSLTPSVTKEHLSFWTRLIRSPLTSFVPQMGLALGLGFLFGRQKRDIILAWFMQTVVFVVFNKVCTSQYFLWYLLLLPLLLPQLSMTRWQAVLYLLVWVATQALWLAEAYQLEFLGNDVFVGLWFRGLVYVVGNCWVLSGIMEAYDSSRPNN
ncbi:GPI mannosyltransferase 1 [Panaeolus papilionaceus]|nr:GPI mannosyltransferase 1 [Panaeolus papilionaceus]